ncbi:MAG: hypothetical protein Q8O89_07915, partial [Nanoarchaeota archaeon]|nr:hypothetical protein [Nanoarchaeota archaeon]
KVDLTKYELEICVEFFNGKAYLFTSRIPALGGLPSGIEGNVYVDIRNEEDLLSAILMLKRGCKVFYKLSAKKLAKKLAVFENGRNLIKAKSKSSYLTLVNSEHYPDILSDNEFTLKPIVLYDDVEIKNKLERYFSVEIT